MITEPSDPDELFVVICEWFQLLADDRWDEACRMLDEPNGYGIHWTSDHIRNVLNLTFAPGCWFRIQHPEGPRISSPDQAMGKLHADVLALNDGSGYSVYHDVPLNGSWSDLTAQFEFLRRSGGLAMILHDLIVM